VKRELYPQVFSFVSGKGGVGKTCLAANFAWVLSQSQKTVLVDLDLQNQGATGLFAKWVGKNRIGVLEAMVDLTRIPEAISSVVAVSDHLLFMPATSFANASSPKMIADLSATQDFTQRLTLLLKQLRDSTDCELIVLDCHGGLDFLSLAAHRLSDRTIVVTEADTVTFNGTLELLSFYTGARLDDASEAKLCESMSRSVPPQFVINRVLPKYNYDDLNRVYKGILGDYGAEFNVTPEVLCYIPVENFISESFGDYPFCVELAPNSVFSKKVHLLAYELTKVIPKGKFSRKLKSVGFRKRVQQCLISNSQRNIELMLRTFVLFTILFTLYAIAVIPLVMLFDSQKAVDALLALIRSPFFVIPTGVLILWVLITLLRALWGALRYYSDQYRFRRLLWTRSSRKPTLGERVLLLRLLLLRAVIPVPLVFVGLVICEVLGFVPYMIFSGAQIFN
jgi:cellulose biosynthesis protein BcsQ